MQAGTPTQNKHYYYYYYFHYYSYYYYYHNYYHYYYYYCYHYYNYYYYYYYYYYYLPTYLAKRKGGCTETTDRMPGLATRFSLADRPCNTQSTGPENKHTQTNTEQYVTSQQSNIGMTNQCTVAEQPG
jgi:hypothetical protein